MDRATGSVVSTRRLGSAPKLFDQANLDLVLSGGQVWVSSFKEYVVHHVRAR